MKVVQDFIILILTKIYNYMYIQNQSGKTISLQVSSLGNIPSGYSIVSYNNGKITISETKQGLQSEVESVLQNSKQIVNNIDTYKQNIIDCEEILKELNPQFAKDKERDDRLNNLEMKFQGVETKIDKILNLVTNK